MSNTAPWAFIALAGILTWVSPRLSLYLFVLASPWAGVNDVLGWDPRARWAILLGLRGAWEAWGTGASCVPRTACRVWLGFTVLAVAGLWMGNTPLLAYELDAPRSALLSFVAGSCGVYAIWQLIRETQQLRALCAVFTASVLISSSVGIAQAAARYRLGVPSSRISGPLSNANYFATYLALAATALVLLIRLKLIRRWFGGIACLAAMLACGLTLSRAGVLAVLVGVGLAWFSRSDRKLISARIVGATAAAVLLAAALLASYLLQFRRNVTNTDEPQRERLVEAGQTVEDLSRLEAFRYSLQLAGEHPLAGVGFGTFAARNYQANGFYVSTHNTLMQVLVGTGLPGGILIFCLIVALLRPLPLQQRRQLFPAAAAFGICSLFGDYLQAIEILVFFAILYLSVRNSGQETQPCAV